MKGVILAGGHGTRLRPLTSVMNKNLLPVGRKPMILYPLEKFVEAGITKICIITGSDHMGAVVDLLGSGVKYNVDITYRVQDQPGGIAQAIGLAEDFAAGDPIVVILGDNLFDGGLQDIVQDWADAEFVQERLMHATVFVKEVLDPERFGVIEYRNGEPVRIVEKPLVPPSKDAVIGVYAYPDDVFDQIRLLKPSPRGELEVTDLNNLYLEKGLLKARKIEGFWVDAGTFDTLELANKWAYERGF